VNDVIGAGQVQSHAARFQADQEKRNRIVRFKKRSLSERSHSENEGHP
jgi:hypothetical protein